VPELPEPTTSRSKAEPHLEALLLQLLRAGDVAEAAERVRAAPGNDVGLAAFAASASATSFIALPMSLPAGNDRDRLDAEQAEHEVVAVAFAL
jgi:hypothetical protein